MDNSNQILQQRKVKLEKIRALGIDAYPIKCKRSHQIDEIRNNSEKYINEEIEVSLVGRIKALRRQGKSGFGNIEDRSGRIQIFIRKDVVGEETYELFKLLDMGDFVQINGKIFITKMGELSIRGTEIILLSKNLRPIPTVKEKEENGKIVRYDEFSDIESRYRRRYLDLLLNPEIKSTFLQRCKIISAMRNFLEKKGFVEVETPSLQPLYGGANAKPFVTHHNALDFDLYLRIATELYLKRLIVGGFEKVFEIGKNFRNEGMDKTHNPEFTAMELYQAYTDLEGMMEITEEMIVYIAKEVYGKTLIEYNGHSIDLSVPWERVSMIELVKKYSGYDASDFDVERLRNFCKEKEIEIDSNAGVGKLIAELFDIYVEPNLIQPTFVIDYPKEISPLAKLKDGNDNIVERFELFIAGAEYGNAFTELNDSQDQRRRLESQAKLRDLGDLEANVVDEDFLQALEYGMPPTGGLGVGVDRIVMFFTGQDSIKDVLLFPTMKPID